MRIYLTGQSNFGNRGCEALVRTTVAVIRDGFPEARFMVPSVDIVRDARQWPQAPDHGVEFVRAPAVPAGIVNWGRLCSRMPFATKLPWPAIPLSSRMLEDLTRADLVISIGGDNYSLDYDLGSLAFFVGIAELGIRLGKPVILWGASVGPFGSARAIERRMARHLAGLSAITVRETSTLAYLRSLDVTASTPVMLAADTAFLLVPESPEGQGFWPAGDEGVLGLNLSPLVAALHARTHGEGRLLREAADFIRQVLDTTKLGVLLVPHVAPLDGGARNSDEHLNAMLMQELHACHSRVKSVPAGLNAAQLKHVIARCRLFIGARTHATIAALSSVVPTLSIAYSTKARGINRDLFGHERLVIDTTGLTAESLRAGLSLLLSEEAQLRACLMAALPEWRARARTGLQAVRACLGSRSELPEGVQS